MTGQPSVEIVAWVIERLAAAGSGDYSLDYEVARALKPPAGIPRLAYTTSLDAALMLVPEGWSVMLDINPGEACCTVHDSSGHVSEPAAVAKTAPLALCIAALRARQIAPHTDE